MQMVKLGRILLYSNCRSCVNYAIVIELCGFQHVSTHFVGFLYVPYVKTQNIGGCECMASILCSRLNDNLGSIKREATSLVRVILSVFPLHPSIRNIVQRQCPQEWIIGSRSPQGSRESSPDKIGDTLCDVLSALHSSLQSTRVDIGSRSPQGSRRPVLTRLEIHFETFYHRNIVQRYRPQEWIIGIDVAQFDVA